MKRGKEVAMILRQIREQRGMTQAQLAEKAGTTQEYVAMIESGARKNPSLDLLKRLAKALGVKVGRMLA